MLSIIRTLATAAIVGLIAVSPAQAQTPTPVRDSDDRVTCSHYTVPVNLATSPTALKIDGELCSTPSERRTGQTVQLLIHGAATNHAYWDFGTIA